MRITPKNKEHLNKISKIGVSALILFLVVLSYFIWDGVKERSVSAKKKNEVSVTAPIEVSPKVKEVNKVDQLNEKEDQKDSGESDNKEIEQGKQPLDNKQSNQDSEQVKNGDQEKNEVDGLKNDETSSQKEDDPDSEQLDESTPLKIGKVVYLTFDDGPHPTASQGILDLLKKYNAKATFFMLEPNMKKHPEAVQKMVEEGHTVGVHGVSHDVKKVYKSPESFVEEMNKAIHFIEEVTPVQTHLVRAPYGSSPYITPAFKQASDQENFILWDWNIDSDDWKYKNGEYVQKVIQQTKELVDKKPLIILMHEKPTTLDHLEKLLKYYQDNGYTMEAINESMDPVQF